DVEAAAREEGEVGALAAVLVAVGCRGDGNEDGHAWVSDGRWRTKGRRQSWPSAPTRRARTAGNCDQAVARSAPSAPGPSGKAIDRTRDRPTPASQRAIVSALCTLPLRVRRPRWSAYSERLSTPSGEPSSSASITSSAPPGAIAGATRASSCSHRS